MLSLCFIFHFLLQVAGLLGRPDIRGAYVITMFYFPLSGAKLHIFGDISKKMPEKVSFFGKNRVFSEEIRDFPIFFIICVRNYKLLTFIICVRNYNFVSLHPRKHH